MDVKIKTDCTDVDWNELGLLLKRAGLSVKPLELIEKAFQNSYSVVFIFDNSTLIACARAISDGAYESAVYDVAVLPEYQKHGIGSLLIKTLHKQLPFVNSILYSKPGVEPFYKKMGYSCLKTGMAIFIDEESKREKGFIE